MRGGYQHDRGRDVRGLHIIYTIVVLSFCGARAVSSPLSLSLPPSMSLDLSPPSIPLPSLSLSLPLSVSLHGYRFLNPRRPPRSIPSFLTVTLKTVTFCHRAKALFHPPLKKKKKKTTHIPNHSNPHCPSPTHPSSSS